MVTMLSFFSSPDLSKFRGKSKKGEPAVKLKNVMWNNSELKIETSPPPPLAPYKGGQCNVEILLGNFCNLRKLFLQNS